MHVEMTPTRRDELDEIIEAIAAGTGVPERFYRLGIDRDRDALLAEHGVMHLHLEGKSSNVIVYLIQYATRVEILSVDDHTHVDERPVGATLTALRTAHLRNLERDLLRAETQALTANVEAARKQALDDAEKLKKSIARLKASLRKQ